MDSSQRDFLPAPPNLSATTQSQAFSAWVVWLSWGGLTLVTALLVAWFGIQIPFSDEWDAIVPFLTGERPVNWQTLWAPHNEHRIFIPRLILLGLDQITGHHFRAGMWVSLSILSLTSAGLLTTIKRIRGYWVWSDAFFPWLMLNWGHAANLLMSFQVQLVLSGCFSCLAAAYFAQCDRPTPKGLALLGFIMAIWPLCSAAGIVCNLVLVLFFAATLWTLFRRGSTISISIGCRSIAWLWLFAIPAICAAVYVPRAALHPAAQDRWQLAHHVLLEFGMAFGAIVQVIGAPLALVTLGLAATALWWLWRSTQGTAANWLSRFGLALVILAQLGLAAAIAWGRSGLVAEIGLRAVLAPRYYTLICPLLVGIYFAVDQSAPEKWKRIIAGGLCLMHIALYPAYVVGGWQQTNQRRLEAAVLVREIEAGCTIPELVEKHPQFFFANDQYFAFQLRQMHDAKIAPFDKIRVEPIDQ